jgi:predicted RNase H-like HicB family nuclease
MRKKESRPEYYAYAASFEKDEDDYWLACFPDLEGCATNAKTLEEAILQAHNILEDYMAIMERQNTPIPVPSPIEAIKVSEGAIVQRVVIPMKDARRRWEDKAVNRMA